MNAFILSLDFLDSNTKRICHREHHIVVIHRDDREYCSGKKEKGLISFNYKEA
jgi:hypothetical protein